MSRMFYIAVTQQVLLFGAESWVLTGKIEAADSGPLRGLGATGGDTGPPKMVGAEGNRLETGTGEDRQRGDGGDDNRHGGGGKNGAGSGGNIGSS